MTLRIDRPATIRGFTLVELSIVLVILGLLVGGVLTGQSLIRAAELRAVTSEYMRYSTAMGTFRDKYFAIPGDMANAASYWTTLTAPNGDGNGQINNTATATTNEPSLFWYELASAGLIEGSYTLFNNAATLTNGTNIPKSKLGQAGWRAIGLGTVVAAGTASYTNNVAPSTSAFYTGNYGNALMVGSGTGAVIPGATTTTGIMKSEDAYNIDTKVDDSKPDSGNVETFESQGNATPGSGCGNLATSTSALAASAYDLTNTSSTACSLVFNTSY